MNTERKPAFIIRQLSSSDLGWFAELQDRGLPAKQRAINFNVSIITSLLPPEVIQRGEAIVHARCLRPEARQEETTVEASRTMNPATCGRADSTSSRLTPQFPMWG